MLNVNCYMFFMVKHGKFAVQKFNASYRLISGLEIGIVKIIMFIEKGN